jgi:hypothetical protein
VRARPGFRTILGCVHVARVRPLFPRPSGPLQAHPRGRGGIQCSPAASASQPAHAPSARLRRLWLLALCLAAGLAGAGCLHAVPARAQSVSPGVVVYDLGDVNVNGTSWSFSGDFAVTAGAFESVTISNYGYCFVGPNDPRAGTAHAGGVFWFTQLTPAPPTPSGTTYTGMLNSGRGGNVQGSVTVMSNGDPTNPSTHVDATLSGSDLSNFSGNTLKVCLLGSN